MKKFIAISLGKILPIVIFLGGGIAIANSFIANKTQIRPMQQQKKYILVSVANLEASEELIDIEAMGTVIPAKTITVTPELGGKIIDMNQNLVEGGFINAGEMIAQIDKRDYETMVIQHESQVADAEYNIEIEKGKQEIAKSEWEMLDEDTKSDANKQLLLRTPHIARLKASLKYAKKVLEESELNVERTKIVAPFNSIVQVKHIEKDQIVGQSSQIATLIGTDKFWVKVNIPVSNLKYVKLPEPNKENGSTAEVLYELSDGTRVERIGKIIRYLGDLEQAGRMARLIVEIDDPLGLKKDNDNINIPMFLNAFVKVKIHGSKLSDVISIERGYLHEGNKVWILNKLQQLEIRKVSILWKRENDVLVSTKYLKPGELLITSKISTPVQNMQLRTQGMTVPVNNANANQNFNNYRSNN